VTAFGESTAERACTTTQVEDTTWARPGEGEVEVVIRRPRVRDIVDFCDLGVLIVHILLRCRRKPLNTRFYFSILSLRSVFNGLQKVFLRGLTYSHIGIYSLLMARAATTSDAFNAVAEPRRREILDYLALGERPVGDLVVKLRLEQPSVSKHLRVLRDVGLVRVRRNGRHMLYRTNAEAIRPLHEWTKTFERLWAHQLLRIKERAEEKARKADQEHGG